MSLFDELKKHATDLLASQTGGGDAPSEAHGGLVENAFVLIKTHGLPGILDKFKESGLGDVVASWVGTGSNLPISPEQLQNALGGESLQAMAAKLGLPLDQVSSVLSKVLPGLVDKLTPQGVVETDPLPE